MAWAANQFKATWSRTVTIVVSGELVRWGDCDGSVLVAIVVSGELVRWGDCDGSVFVIRRVRTFDTLNRAHD